MHHPDEFEKHDFSGQTAGWSPQTMVYIVSKRIPPKNLLNSGLVICGNVPRFLAQGSSFCFFSIQQLPGISPSQAPDLREKTQEKLYSPHWKIAAAN